MNAYLLITIAGLILKLCVSHKIFFDFPKWHTNIRPELLAFVVVFLLYSVVQILLFGPESWGTAIGLERIYVIRVYYFWDAISLLAGGYLLLSMFSVRFHKRLPALVLLFSFVFVGGYFLVLTPAMVDGIRPGPRGLITLSGGAEYVFIGQAMVYIFTAAIVFGLYRGYQSAKSNVEQIKNIYALVAALIYAISCLVGLYLTFPILMASRGIIFYVVVVLILQRSRLFDIRPVAPVTIEAATLREITKIFRDYASEDVGHRQSVKLLERSMVAYKLRKVSGFKDDAGSSLPQVASSMDVKLSSLYDIMKRLDLEKPGTRG